jgi:subtilisin family serine protease
MLAAICRCALAILALSRAAVAEPRKPPLPPGRDPGGIAIALISTGIDYTQPDVAARLARDGEGELIGWDAVDGDNRPLAAHGATPASWAPNWGGDGTLLARAVGARGRRLIPVRISPAEPASLALAVGFLAETPARIVALPMWSALRAEWEPFQRAASRFSDLLFVVAAGDEGKNLDADPVWPAAFGLGNVLVVSLPGSAGMAGEHAANAGHAIDALLATASPGGGAQAVTPNTSLAAVRAADAIAGCWPELIAANRGSALKAALLAAAQKAGAAETPILAPCARATGPP